MAESAGKIGFGATFSIGGVLAEVVDIKPPKGKVKKVDFTHLRSDDGAMERKPGLIDWDDAELTLNYTAASHATLYGFFVARDNHACAIAFPDGHGAAFTGFISEFEGPEAKPEDRMESKVKIAVAKGLAVYT